MYYSVPLSSMKPMLSCMAESVILFKDTSFELKDKLNIELKQLICTGKDFFLKVFGFVLTWLTGRDF